MTFFMQVYSNTPETINLIIEVFVEVAHKQICYLGEVSHNYDHFIPRITLKRTTIFSEAVNC